MVSCAKRYNAFVADGFKIDKTAFSIVSLHEQDALEETRYWLSKTPQERWAAVEYLRQLAYGYDPARTRLQRVLAVLSAHQVEYLLIGGQALPDGSDTQGGGMQHPVHSVGERCHPLGVDLLAEDALDELLELRAPDLPLRPAAYFHNHSPAGDGSPSSTAEVYTEVEVT
jgi:hypothetical protein